MKKTTKIIVSILIVFDDESGAKAFLSENIHHLKRYNLKHFLYHSVNLFIGCFVDTWK